MISREKIKNAFLNHKSARGYTVLDSTKTISKRLEHQLFHVLIILILAARDSVHFSSNRDASSSFSFFLKSQIMKIPLNPKKLRLVSRTF
jgi:hypothetical protein